MSLQIADAKRRLLLPELARILHVPGKVPERDGELVPCFWPERHKHNDRRPSFNFHAGLTRYRCFGCGAAGDGPDLIADWCGIAPQEAVKRFVEMAGGKSLVVAGTSRPRPAEAKEPPSRDPWADTAEKLAKRRSWPDLRRGTRPELGSVALLRGLDMEAVLAADRLGWLQFCDLAGHSAWVLCSDCGRIAQARRLDGAEWEHTGHRFKAWSLPGSCAAVPLGLSTVANGVPFVAVASGGPDMLALLELVLAEGREADCAILGILGESVKLAAPVVRQCGSRRVRLFPHNDDAGRRAAATWADQLGEAGASVDAFDFAPFGVKDLNDWIKLKPEARDCDALPK